MSKENSTLIPHKFQPTFARTTHTKRQQMQAHINTMSCHLVINLYSCHKQHRLEDGSFPVPEDGAFPITAAMPKRKIQVTEQQHKIKGSPFRLLRRGRFFSGSTSPPRSIRASADDEDDEVPLLLNNSSSNFDIHNWSRKKAEFHLLATNVPTK